MKSKNIRSLKFTPQLEMPWKLEGGYWSYPIPSLQPPDPSPCEEQGPLGQKRLTFSEASLECVHRNPPYYFSNFTANLKLSQKKKKESVSVSDDRQDPRPHMKREN